MAALWVTLGIIAFLLLLLLLPIVAVIQYEDSLSLKIRYGFLQFRILPPKPKKKPDKPSGKSKKLPSTLQKLRTQHGLSGLLSLFNDIARLRSLLKIRIKKFSLEIIVAKEDPAETAIAYGRTCLAVYSAFAVLNNIVHIRVKEFSITPDFMGTSSHTSFSAMVSVRTLSALHFLIRLIIKTMRAKAAPSKTTQNHQKAV